MRIIKNYYLISQNFGVILVYNIKDSVFVEMESQQSRGVGGGPIPWRRKVQVMGRYRVGEWCGWMFLVLGLGGCTGGSSDPPAAPVTFDGSYPIEVTCTTGMVADIVRAVGGEKVQVKQLMGEGVDPHLYKASPGDIADLDRADLVVYSGLHLEGKLSEILERMSRRRRTWGVAEGLDSSKLLRDAEGTIDPHIWFDVSLWADGVLGVVKVLAEFDPSGKEFYETNGAAYAKELRQLHEEAKESIARIPAGKRVLVTAHDAFGYFARAYGLEVRSIQGISTDSEAGLKEINELVKFLVDRKISAVFVENIISERNVRSLVEGCRAKDHDVKVGGELYSDALGKPGSPQGTYVGMVRHNVDVIVGSLQ
jgi:manganese/zinc/iron transport system substrate-binding protein